MTRTTAKTSVLNAIFLANIFLILLALDKIPWIKWLAILPWITAILVKGGIKQIASTAKENKTLLLLSLAISIFIYTGCWQYHCYRQEKMSYLIPLVWIPITSIVKNNLPTLKNSGFSLHLFLIFLLAILTTSCTLLWQHFVANNPRPPAFSFNVLISPMLMGMTCILFMIKSRWPSSEQHAGRLHYISVAALIFATAGSMITFSKTGLLIFAVAVAIKLATTPSKRKILLWASLPIVTIWAFFLSDALNGVRVDIAKYEEGAHRTSTGERLDAIKWATENALSVPLQGIGKDALNVKFNQRWRDWNLNESDVSPMPHLHNDYLQIAIAYGIICSACFTLFWITLASKTAKAVARAVNNEQSLHTNSWLLTFIGIFITAFMVDSFTHWPSTWLMINASLGIALGLIQIDVRAASSEH